MRWLRFLKYSVVNKGGESDFQPPTFCKRRGKIGGTVQELTLRALALLGKVLPYEFTEAK